MGNPLDVMFPNKDDFDRMVDAINRCAAGTVTDPDLLDNLFAQTLNGQNTSTVFKSWYNYAKALAGASLDRYALMERFCKMLAGSVDGKVFTLRGYKEEVSSATPLTPLDDLAGFSAAQLCTENSTPVADWADEHPMGGWYVRFIGFSKADGSMDILAIEGVEDIDLSGETAPLYTGCMSMYKKEWTDGDYSYKSFRSTPDAEGEFSDPEENLRPDNSHRYFIWHSTTPGTLNTSGGLTSGVGGKAAVFNSESSGLTKMHVTGAYEGLMTDCDSSWALDMWQLRHFDKENSNVAEGCTNYNLQYLVAAAESNVKRVLLSTANAANLVVGSSVWVGDPGSNTNYDRGQSYMRNICDMAVITSIESVTVGGSTYAAVNLDLADAITTTATTRLSTAPWRTGSTDKLPGHKDGCLHSLTAGKGPLRVMGVEFLIGCYDVGADPLYTVTANTTSGFDYVVSTVRDATKQATSVTSNYEATGITGTGIASGWNYVKKFVSNTIGILFPGVLNGGADSSKYFKSAFYGSNGAGVRVPWRRGNLRSGGVAGLACEDASLDPSSSFWYGAPRLGGSGKTRGKQAA